MAVLRMPDIRKLSLADAQKKLSELERLRLELMGEGKTEKTKAVKKAIARLKTFLHVSARKAASGVVKVAAAPEPAAKMPDSSPKKANA